MRQTRPNGTAISRLLIARSPEARQKKRGFNYLSGSA
jgi:hypothetical protein